MGVQYAVSLGTEVTVFDITDEKREDALRMGAVRYVNVNNPDELKGLEKTFDFILSTIPTQYEPAMYMRMLKLNGQLGIVGLPALRNMSTVSVADLVFTGMRKVFGSQIGGIKETQEMLDYSVAHNIYPEVEVIRADGAEIDRAYQNVLDGKVKFRYVIDMKTLKYYDREIQRIRKQEITGVGHRAGLHGYEPRLRPRRGQKRDGRPDPPGIRTRRDVL